jgi:acetyl-CoA/propionyl-CoA carboxylase biotin carboxyl carrier protein
MLRALDELEVEGIATTVPAHKAILGHPDFAAATHSTKWVEETLDLSGVSATPATAAPAAEGDGEAPRVRRDVDVEVNGRRYSVALWVPDLGPVMVAGAGGGGRPRPKAAAASAKGGAAGAGQVTVPMQGTIVKVLVKVGDAVEVGQALCVLEAMKMENNIEAAIAGTVAEIRVEPGSAVGAGDVVLVISAG